MSSLDKAFIKAYRKSSAERAPPTPASVHRLRTARQPALAGREVESQPAAPCVVGPGLPSAQSEPRDPEPANSPADDTSTPPNGSAPISAAAQDAPPIPFTRFHTAHVGAPAPHTTFVEPAPATIASASAKATAIAPAHGAASGLGAASSPVADAARLPLEAPPHGSRPVILPLAGAAPVWRPVFEVANFTWPKVTEALLEAAFVQFRAAAGDLAEASRRHRKLVAVTAAHRGEGCTAVTLALAKVLAEQQRVILVDAHFDAPTLADQLGVAAQVGWEENLTGDKPLIEALVESIEDRLIVLPLRQPAAEEWSFSVARLKATFDELRKHCDLVLIDAGPIGDPGDRRRPLAWAAPCRVDRALVVRDLRTTGDEQMAEIDQRLHGSGIAQWNFVENFAAA